jgi:hypothetical protein
MGRVWSIIFGVSLAALAARDAAAQWNAARFDAGRNRVYTTFGLDPALVTTVGYGRAVPLAGHDVELACDVGVVAAHMDTGDFRARLEAQTSLWRWRSVRLTGGAAFITRGTENIIYRGLNFGSDFTGTLGLYHRGRFAAAEFGFDKAIITHIAHSDWYRTYYYPDAKDGWYLTGGGTFHYGVAAGLALGKTEVVGRFGWRRSERFNEVVPPLYGSLGLGFAY